MLKRIGAEESGEFKAVASGTLPSGKPVVVNADGTVSVVAPTTVSGATGSSTSFTSETILGGTHGVVGCFDSASNKVVIAYNSTDGSWDAYAIVGTVSGTSISFGTPVAFETNTTVDLGDVVVFDSSNNKVVISYKDDGNSNYGTSVVGTVSGTSISFGTPVVFNSGAIVNGCVSCFDSSNNKIFIAYRDQANSGYGTAIVGTVSGTSISFGSEQTIGNTSTWSNISSCVFDSNVNKVAVCYRNDSKGKVSVGTISGTSISFGSEVVLESSAAVDYSSMSFDPVANTIVLAYNFSSRDLVRTATISGTSISFGTKTDLATGSQGTPIETVYHAAANKTVIIYRDSNNSNRLYTQTATVSGTDVTVDTTANLTSESVYYGCAIYDSTSEKIVMAYKDEAGGGKAIVYSPSYTSTNLTSENYIGMSRGVAFQTGSAASAGTTVTFCANLTLMHKDSSVYDSSNNKVVIGYAGSSSGGQRGNARVGTIDNSDNSITFGSEVEFESGGTDHVTATFDSNSNKVVFAYRDEGNSNAGTAVVGTVSGTSISFGTPVVFESGSTLGIGMTFDTNSNKVVISYSDQTDGQDGTAVVGTVSGTSISFGSPVKFEVGNVDYTSATFDSSNNKVVISFSDNDNSNYGTAIVGTVSGTSISFGSAVVFASEYTIFNPIVFDSNNNKVVVSYRAGTDGDKGKSVVGTVSGTSISFGSVATFNNAGTSEMSAVFDTSLNQVVIAYQDMGDSNKGTAIAGTVSGTSISFGSELIYQTGAVADNTLVYDTNANRFAVFYRDNGSPYNGKANVFNTSTAATTRAEVADGGKASMDIIGSVSDNQIGLTAGQQYFVQTDGTIGTTAATPSVLAGTAISATELLVKT